MPDGIGEIASLTGMGSQVETAKSRSNSSSLDKGEKQGNDEIPHDLQLKDSIKEVLDRFYLEGSLSSGGIEEHDIGTHGHQDGTKYDDKLAVKTTSSENMLDRSLENVVPEDTTLENMIGNTLRSLNEDGDRDLHITDTFKNMEPDRTDKEKEKEKVEDDNLIYTHLSLALSESVSNTPEVLEDTKKEPEAQNRDELDKNDIHGFKDEDLQLSRAITSALKEFIPSGIQLNDDNLYGDNNSSSNSNGLEEHIQNDEKHYEGENLEIPESHEDSSLKSPNDDNFIVDAINEAFDDAIQTHSEKAPSYNRDAGRYDSISRNSGPSVSQPQASEHDLVDSNISISEDMLKEIASQISNQVQESLDDRSLQQSRNLNNVPQIDESVLAHFQQEANKEEKSETETGKNENIEQKSEENTLQNTLVNVVKAAIDNATVNASLVAHRHASEETSQETELDIDQLKMNEILQNAFHMAMEQSSHHTNIHEQSETRRRSSQQIDLRERNLSELKTSNESILDKISYPVSSTTSFLESLKRSNDIVLTTGKKDISSIENLHKLNIPKNEDSTNLKEAIKNLSQRIDTSDDKSLASKPLSIAETLALHRSSMGRRNNHALNFDKESTDLGKHISSERDTSSKAADNLKEDEFSTLLKHIGNLHSKALPYANQGTLSKILETRKTTNSDKSMSEPFILAKRFLKERLADLSNLKAVALIDEVLKSLKVESHEECDVSRRATIPEPLDNELIESDFMNSLVSSIVSAISGFSSRPPKNISQHGEKPRIDSVEYRERIRLENRQRKKRWREENAERNKDNDLRSRVIKRANTIFGDIMTTEKKAWIEEEFGKRREKRIAKQKKDKMEKENKGIDNECLEKRQIKGKDVNVSNHDNKLIQDISDVFNIVSAFASKADPEVGLLATSVAIATAAATYASKNSSMDCKALQIAVTDILSSLLEEPKSISTTAKTKDASSDMTFHQNSISDVLGISQPSIGESRILSIVRERLDKDSDIISNLATLMRNSKSQNGFSSFSFLNSLDSSLIKNFDSNAESRKRSAEQMFRDVKRFSNYSLSSHETGSMSTLSELKDDIRTSKLEAIINGTNSLKIPQYGKPETKSGLDFKPTSNVAVKHEPILLLESGTPFISNKVAKDGEAKSEKSDVSSTFGLKKPGIFQRPSYFKHKPKVSISGPGGR